MKYLYTVLISVMSFSSQALPSQALQINDESITHGYLDNGLRYIIKPNVDEGDDKVYFGLIVNTGSYNEEDDQRGYAHVLEHAMFRSQTAVEDPFTFFEEKGGSVNAYTSFHETVYFPSVRKGNEQDALDFLSDIASRLNIDEIGLKLDQEIVLNEFNSSGNPHAQVSPYLNQFYFGRTNRYLKRFPIGTKSSLLDIKLNRVNDFYQSWYHPKNMTLLIIGDVDPELLVTQVKGAFASISKTGESVIELPVVEPRNTTYDSGNNEDENFLYQEFVFNSGADKSQQERDYLKFTLLTMLIQNDLDNKIKEFELPFKQAYIEDLDFGIGQLKTFKLELSEIKQRSDLELALIFLEQYKLDIIQNGFSKNEIKLALNQLKNNMELFIDDPSMQQNSTLFGLYLHEVNSGYELYPIDDFLTVVDAFINSISNDEIKLNIKTIFSSNVITQVIFDSGSSIRQKEMERWQKEANALFEKEGLILNKKDKEVTAIYSIPESITFNSKIENENSEFLEYPVQVWTLDNGVTVKYVHQPNDAKQTYMMFVSDIQPYHLASDLRLPFVNFTHIQLLSGLNNLSIEEIGTDFSSKKMGLQNIPESTSFYGLAQYEQIDELASYMHRMLAEPVESTETVLDLIDNLKKDYAANQQSFPWLSEKNRGEHLFQGSPYLSAVTGADADNLTVKNIEKIRQLLTSKKSNPTIIITGELSKEDAMQLSERYFATLLITDEYKEIEKSPINDLPLPESGRFNIGFNHIQYDNVIMYYTSKKLTKNAKNIDQAKLFNYLFSTYLFEELREKRGLVYSPFSTYQFNDDALPFGFFYVSFQADVLNEDEFYAIVDEVTDSFFETKIDLETLNRAKEALNVEVQAELVLTTILSVYLNHFKNDFDFDLYYEQKGVDDLNLDEVNAFKGQVRDEYVRTIFTTYPR
ncbi:MAG: insulinase family protein [Saccharospirillaceae bacterium]|nr:insulinase family protein [Pseudomonadales bacterium]NRB78834.1 insulinase family protein [Saccharospirillaceae bacterium]